MDGTPVPTATGSSTWPARRLAPLLPWASIAAGIALVLLSLVPEVHDVDTVQFRGQIDPGMTVTDALGRSDYGIARISFETRPSCAIRLFVLNQALAERYLSSGSLPDPAQSLNCDRTEAVVSDLIALLVFQNARDESTESYSVIVELFVETLPYGLVALPAMALVISGTSILIFRSFRRGLRQLEAESRRKYRAFSHGKRDEDPNPVGKGSSGSARVHRSSLPEGEEAEKAEMQK